MSSFSCPHFDVEKDYCLRLLTDCVPGRKGCVLPNTSAFLFPVEERVREKEESRGMEHPDISDDC